MTLNHFKIQKKLLILALLLIFNWSFSQNKEYNWQETSKNGYTYKSVSNDPMQTRFYTLKNGLKVILSVNKKTPRVAVNIAVKSGSNSDPKLHTGLAHYLEHILFKGTDKFGTLDWNKEKPLLDKIEDLYETYNSTTDKTKRNELYKEIDRVSNEASKFAIAGEYNKLMKGIGSQGTNAHTWVEETVYKEDIPSNAMDKFLTIEAERFRNPVVRLFHTELEAVYEEKNRSLDNDDSKVNEQMNALLFPTHNYGQQTTIGTIEHLKNPSIKAIKEYYNTYYIPNNMAIIMVGDFNPDELIKKIDSSFSYMKPKSVTHYNPVEEKPITKPIVSEIFGPAAENIKMGWRTPASYTKDAEILNLISSILSNGKAGLFDININQKQGVQKAYNYLLQHKDYGIFSVGGSPKKGQSLEEVKTILMTEIEKLKKGEFDEALIKSIIANNKLNQQQALKYNSMRLNNLLYAYIKSDAVAWDKDVKLLDNLTKLKKEDIIRVANTYLTENNVTIYKRKGEDKNIVKVEKPSITPIETNAGKTSEFVTTIENTSVEPIEPKWVNFKKDFTKTKFKNTEIFYAHNKDNQLFSTSYRFNMGSHHNAYLPLAISYLEYLSTDTYTSEEINQKLYALASSYSLSYTDENTSVDFTGLQENFKEVSNLVEHILTKCQPNETALNELKNRILKSREDNKLNKDNISKGLSYYAIYGKKNPFNDVLSNDEIKAITSKQLISILHTLFQYKHNIIYFGPDSEQELKKNIEKAHVLPEKFTSYPEKKAYTFTKQDKNKVLFADYNMVQSDIKWVRNIELYKPSEEALIKVFNNYFGGGMGSIVFQTIRESKALAYSTYADYAIPSNKNQQFRMHAYVGSQSDKMMSAINGMNELLNDLPHNEKAFQSSKEAIKSSIQTQRVTDSGPILLYLDALNKGIDYDIREKTYNSIDQLTFKDLKTFHNQKIANKFYTYYIVGSKDKISDDDLNKIGEVEKLSLKEIFGY